MSYANDITEDQNGQGVSVLGSHVISGRELTHAHYCYVQVHSNAVVVKRVRHQKQQRPPKHVRGVVTRFTARSRSRMIRKTAMIRHLKRPYFVTLTYPGRFDFEPAQIKAHLFALKKRIARRFNNAGMLWRLELKRRQTGASAGQVVPHYHLVLWGMNLLQTDMYQVINKMWWEIVWGGVAGAPRYDQPEAMTAPMREHRSHGVDVQVLANFRAVLAYVAKYAAKVEDDETEATWGRRWGVCLNADLSASYKWGLTWAEHLVLRRTLRKLLERRGSAYAWWLKSGYPSMGYTVVGVGDDDEPHELAINRTVMRILAHTKGYEN